VAFFQVRVESLYCFLPTGHHHIARLPGAAGSVVLRTRPPHLRGAVPPWASGREPISPGWYTTQNNPSLIISVFPLPSQSRSVLSRVVRRRRRPRKSTTPEGRRRGGVVAERYDIPRLSERVLESTLTILRRRCEEARGCPPAPFCWFEWMSECPVQVRDGGLIVDSSRHARPLRAYMPAAIRAF
jgi:hypothetical protein